MRRKDHIDIAKQIAKDEGLSLDDVIDIVDTPFEVLHDIIKNSYEKDLYETIKIPGFATFYPSEKRVKELKKIKEKGKKNGSTI